MSDLPEQRETPLWRHVVLLVGFVLVLVAGVLTVLVPELEDEDEGEQQEPERATGAAEPEQGGAAGSPPPSK